MSVATWIWLALHKPVELAPIAFKRAEQVVVRLGVLVVVVLVAGYQFGTVSVVLAIYEEIFSRKCSVTRGTPSSPACWQPIDTLPKIGAEQSLLMRDQSCTFLTLRGRTVPRKGPAANPWACVLRVEGKCQQLVVHASKPARLPSCQPVLQKRHPSIYENVIGLLIFSTDSSLCISLMYWARVSAIPAAGGTAS